MAKIIISGNLKEEDIMLIAKFFREFWKSREENIFMMIEEGTQHLSKEECMELMKQVFTDDGDKKDWTEQPINEEMLQQFKETFKKNRRLNKLEKK